MDWMLKLCVLLSLKPCFRSLKLFLTKKDHNDVIGWFTHKLGSFWIDTIIQDNVTLTTTFYRSFCSRAFSVCLKLSHHQLGWQQKSLQCLFSQKFNVVSHYQLETKSLVVKWDISVLRKGGNFNSKLKIP